MSKRRQQPVHEQRRHSAVQEGWRIACRHRVLDPLARECRLTIGGDYWPRDGWANVDSAGWIEANPWVDGTPEDWAWVFAHLLLHLGLGHLDKEVLTDAGAVDAGDRIDPAYAAACDAAVLRFSEVVRSGGR